MDDIWYKRGLKLVDGIRSLYSGPGRNRDGDRAYGHLFEGNGYISKVSIVFPPDSRKDVHCGKTKIAFC